MILAEQTLLKVCKYNNASEMEDNDDITISEAKEAMQEIAWEAWKFNNQIIQETQTEFFKSWYNQQQKG